MKKLFVLILAIIYLAEASGMTVYEHFCMDKLVSWGLAKGGHKCPSCGMEKTQPGKGFCKGCCKDEHKTIKITIDHKAEVFSWKASHFGEILPAFSSTDFSVPDSSATVTWNSIHAPPLIHKFPTYLFNCVFRI